MPNATRRRQLAENFQVLSIDIGGTGLKAAVVDQAGHMLTARARIPTPYPCPPQTLMKALGGLVSGLPEHDCISIGFPGVIRGGRVVTAPHFGTCKWSGFFLAREASRQLRGPARVINDAEMQGMAVIAGKGLELVLTLGTGAGTGLFRDGELMPHLELAHHPIHGKKSYDDYIGNAALEKVGRKHWNKRVAKTIEILSSLLWYDHLFIGGGNARKITLKKRPSTTIVANDAGLEGGAALWRPASLP